MKVLLLQPPIEDFYDTPIRTYPLSLLYLGGKIRDRAEVSLTDLRTNRKPRPLAAHPFPELTPYYREGVKTPFSLFSAYSRYGLEETEIEEEIRRQDPDVVCISSLFSTYSLEALETAKIVRRVKEGIVTVVGGIHPTLFPRHCLASPFVDYVIRGEGETPLLRLVEALSEGRDPGKAAIPGLCVREGERFRIAEPYVEADIDGFPDRSLVDPTSYRIGKKNYTFFLTSRGCPFHCAFCGKPPAPYRKRSLSAMERELGDVIDRGIEAVDFEDDMLNLDARFFRSILDLFKGTGLTLSAMNGIYTGNLDAGTLEKMFSSGFRRLNFALVDISRPVMDSQKRPFPANFLDLLPFLEDSAYLTEAHFIIGLPGQTPEEVVDTMVFLMGKRILPGPSIFYLAPGSPIFAEAAGDDWEGLIKSMRSSAMYPVNPLMPRETLFTFMKLTRFINFVKSTLDRGQGTGGLSGLARSPGRAWNPVTQEIVDTLCREKRFICYDPRSRQFADEPQDRALTGLFFQKARGKVIKGFKTANTLVVD